MLEFRKAAESDIDDIMRIIGQAQAYFKEQEIDQWQNGYPSVETIAYDIAQRVGYVLLNDRTVVATMALSFEQEKSYERIYDGKWLSDRRYAVIHRIAVADTCKGKGLSSDMVKNAEDICERQGIGSLRVDTHENNRSMQNLLRKNGFRHCGTIYLADQSKRLAFEKLL